MLIGISKYEPVVAIAEFFGLGDEGASFVLAHVCRM
jgi:hypothetical protein